LGSVVVPEPIIVLSQATKGSFANPYEAGNIGAGVLKRFNVTFDYERQQVILEKNANFDHRDEYDKSGLWLHLVDGAWEVIEAAPGSPAAAAGLRAGDRILKVGGQTPADLSLSDLRQKLRESPVGTEISLTVQSGGETRIVPLILRELFCKCSAALLPERKWLT
jgi:C-terminal processing protease CtpA/Prc